MTDNMLARVQVCVTLADGSKKIETFTAVSQTAIFLNTLDGCEMLTAAIRNCLTSIASIENCVTHK